MQQPKIFTHKTQWSSNPGPNPRPTPSGHPLTDPTPTTPSTPPEATEALDDRALDNSTSAAAASNQAVTGPTAFAPSSGGSGDGGGHGSSAADLDARYGRGRRSRRPLIIGVVAVVAAAGLAWLAWAAIVGSNPPVTSRLLRFEVTSATSATATIQVDRTKSVEANCRLQAKSADFSIVGELTLTIPADSPRHQTLPATLTTQRSATSVVLIGCTTADSHRPH
ncbi:DUF4307 domain-containing protein [Kribbella sp. NBC_00889]|uniref:DUF4307 domain-containing protein n=1 Tax=Kribbella sp. NBC_00889 TaxID=2975974 RepID=UPI00386EEF39|nr:DUF4307 domain-containing protein [Kribbella sp. NBC_00889]